MYMISCHIKEMDTPEGFAVIFKGKNFSKQEINFLVLFFFFFQKWGYSLRKELAATGSKFFPLRVALSEKGG